ncbi:MAG TPA: tetratricopeptide repeat protein [Armatimonadota bacterium]|nr:tetratricopeptide repeat protein [Armatimonadota bacterium]
MRQLLLVRLVVALCLTVVALPAVWAAPSPADKSYALAIQYDKLGNKQQAADEYQRFLASFPDDERVPQVDYLLGIIYQQQQSYAKALNVYSQALVKANGLNFTALRADTHYQMGECYRIQGNYVKAVQAYENCLQLNSKVSSTDNSVKFIVDRADLNVRAQYWLAESLFRSNREEEALPKYTAVLNTAPTHEYAPWACYSVGVIHYDLVRYDDAIADFNRLAADYKDFSAINSGRVLQGMAYASKSNAEGDAAAKDADFKKALDTWNTVAAAETATPDDKQQAVTAIAKAYLDRKDIENAVTAYRQAVAIADPTSKFAIENTLQLGHILYNAKRYSEASKEYTKVSQNKKYADFASTALYWLGNSMYQEALAGKDVQAYHNAITALTGFQAAGDKDDTAASAALITAYCYEDLAGLGEKDARDKGVSTYTRILKQWPKSDQAVQARIGISRMTQSMTPEQLRTLTGSLPTGVAAWDMNLQLAKKEFDAGHYDNALTSARQVLDGKPAADITAQAAFIIGLSLHKLGRMREAIPYFQQVVTVTPTGELVPFARRALVQAYLDLHSYPEACTAAAALMALPLQGDTETKRANEQAERLMYLAAAYLGNQQQNEAAATYRKVVTQFASSPLAPNALMNVAAIAESQGDTKTAIATYQEFITKYPDDDHVPDAFFQLGVDLAKQKDYDKAIDAFRNVPESSKFADQAAYATAWAYADQKMMDKAVEQFRLMTDKFPGSPLAVDCWFHLGEDKLAKKDYGEAMRYYSRAADLCKDTTQAPLITYQLGVSAYFAKEYGIAANAFGKIVANYPTSDYAADSAFWRASSLEGQGTTQAVAARDGYLQYTVKYPDGAFVGDAAVGVGRMDIAANQTTNARVDLQKALDLCDKLDKSDKKDIANHAKALGCEAQFLVAQSYYTDGDFNQALKEFAVLSMSQYEPWSSRARLQVARCWAKQGDKDSARKILLDMINSNPNSEGAKQAPDVAKEIGVQLAQ